MCLDEVLDEPLPDEVECYMLARKMPGPQVKRVREGMWVAVEDTPITGRVVRYKDGKLTHHGFYLIERDDGEGWSDETIAPTGESLYWWVYKDELVKLGEEVKPNYVTVWVEYPCPIGEEVIAEELDWWEWGYPWGFHCFEKPPREFIKKCVSIGDCVVTVSYTHLTLPTIYSV